MCMPRFPNWDALIDYLCELRRAALLPKFACEKTTVKCETKSTNRFAIL